MISYFGNFIVVIMRHGNRSFENLKKYIQGEVSKDKLNLYNCDEVILKN